MLKRKPVAILSLVVGLCVPAFAQEGGPAGRTIPAVSTDASGSNLGLKADHPYHHLDNPAEEELLDAGPAETSEKTVNFLRAYEPEIWKEIKRMKTEDPEECEHMITMESHHVRALEDLKAYDPLGFRLSITELRAHHRVGALARSCRDNDHANKPALRAAAEKLFDARQASEQHQIELDREDISERTKDLRSRKSMRTRIVDHYIQSISIQDAERW